MHQTRHRAPARQSLHQPAGFDGIAAHVVWPHADAYLLLRPELPLHTG